TTFKVVRDQLRISDGWVRCGRCSEVFDATVDLHDTATVPEPEAGHEVVAAEAASATTLDRDVDDSVGDALQPEARAQPEPEPGEPARNEVEVDFFEDEHEPSNPHVRDSGLPEESTDDALPAAAIVVVNDQHW